MDSPLKISRAHIPGGTREMFAIAFPMMVSSACETVMIFTDRLFLAKLGPEQMSAAMAGGLTCFMMTTFFVGVISYTTALVAQYFGAARPRDCAVAAVQAVIIAIVSYPLLLATRPIGHWVFERAHVAPEQLGPQKIYFDVLLTGSIVMLLRTALSGFFTGIGRTGVVVASACVAMVVNVPANYILVFGKLGFPALGIYGSAVGTVLGGLSGIAVFIVMLALPKIRSHFELRAALRFDRTIMLTLLRFGYPASLEFFLNILAFNLLILQFHSRGVEAATAVTIAFNWDMVSFIPLLGVNMGVMTLVGRYMGARQPEIAHRATISGLKIAWTYGFFVLLAFWFCSGFLVDMFRPTGDPAVFDSARPAAVFMLQLVSIYVLADATNLVFGGALRGAGDTLWAMVISVGLHWALFIIVGALLKFAHLEIQSAWIALVAIIPAFSSLFYLRYRTGAWKKIQVINDAPPLANPLPDGLHEPAEM